MANTRTVGSVEGEEGEEARLDLSTRKAKVSPALVESTWVVVEIRRCWPGGVVWEGIVTDMALASAQTPSNFFDSPRP